MWGLGGRGSPRAAVALVSFARALHTHLVHPSESAIPTAKHECGRALRVQMNLQCPRRAGALAGGRKEARLSFCPQAAPPWINSAGSGVTLNLPRTRQSLPLSL